MATDIIRHHSVALEGCDLCIGHGSQNQAAAEEGVGSADVGPSSQAFLLHLTD